MVDPGLRPFYDRFWGPEKEALRRAHDTHTFYEPARRWLRSRGGVLVGRRVLEVGAGEGALAEELAREGAQVVAMDLSPVAVSTMKERSMALPIANRYESIVGEAEAIPCPDGSFDELWSSKLWMHVEPKRFLAEARRVLLPGGRLCLVEPLAEHPAARIHRAFHRDFEGLACRYPRWDELLLPGAGFEEVARRACFLLSPALFPRTSLQGLDAGLMRIFPPLRRFAWVGAVDARKG